MSESALRYDYRFDPEGDSTAARICRMVGAGRNVLELGCAAGAMSAVMTQHYHCRVTGVEYDPVAAQEARKYCDEVLVASLEASDWDAPLHGRKFDTIVAADVLEHLHEPDACLRRLGSLLTDDGRLVISVPNIAHGGVIAGLLNGEFDYTDIGLLDRTHVHFFTRKSLGRMLHGCGYRVSHVDTVDTGPWHPEFSEQWKRLPPSLHDWLAASPEGRAYQVLMLAHRDAAPGPWAEDAAIGHDDWLQTAPATTAAPASDAAPTPAAASDTVPSLESTEDSARQELLALQQQYRALQAQLEDMHQSRSWRLTAPLRRILNLLK